MSAGAQEQILDAVTSVIVRDGVRGTSMRSVADEADVSLGLISYHFDDKRSLIVAAFQRATDALLDSARESVVDAGEAPTDQLRAYLRAAFETAYLDSEYLGLRIALWAVSRTDADLAAVEADLYERYAVEMRRLLAVARPKLSAKQLSDRVTDIIVTQNGMWLNWARFANAEDLDRGIVRCEQIALS